LFRNESPGAGNFLGLRLVRANGSPAIGAVARVNLPDGRKLVAQVDGGNGHSGRRSPEIHFGLGAVVRTEPVQVELAWRDQEGTVRHGRLPVLPGWHTVELTSADAVVRQSQDPSTR
jgi:hypothetical protein